MLAVIGVAFESNNIHNCHFGKLVFFIFLSLIYDFGWLFLGLFDWGDVSPLEGKSLSSIRRLSVVMSFVVFILKVSFFYLLLFSFIDSA